MGKPWMFLFLLVCRSSAFADDEALGTESPPSPKSTIDTDVNKKEDTGFFEGWSIEDEGNTPQDLLVKPKQNDKETTNKTGFRPTTSNPLNSSLNNRTSSSLDRLESPTTTKPPIGNSPSSPDTKKNTSSSVNRSESSTAIKPPLNSSPSLPDTNKNMSSSLIHSEISATTQPSINSSSSSPNTNTSLRSIFLPLSHKYFTHSTLKEDDVPNHLENKATKVLVSLSNDTKPNERPSGSTTILNRRVYSRPPVKTWVESYMWRNPSKWHSESSSLYPPNFHISSLMHRWHKLLHPDYPFQHHRYQPNRDRYHYQHITDPFGYHYHFRPKHPSLSAQSYFKPDHFHVQTYHHSQHFGNYNPPSSNDGYII